MTYVRHALMNGGNLKGKEMIKYKVSLICIALLSPGCGGFFEKNYYPQGTQGPKGDAGEQGPQGEQGDIGPQGEPGQDGTVGGSCEVTSDTGGKNITITCPNTSVTFKVTCPGNSCH